PRAAIAARPWMMRARVARDLLLLVLGAVLVRSVRVLFFAPVVEIDGAEYSRIAENLLAGHGYVGLIPGHERMLPPLYSVAIAAVQAVLGIEAPLAGRLVSLGSGAVTVAALYLVALRLSGLAAARATGALAAFMPSLVLAGSS